MEKRMCTLEEGRHSHRGKLIAVEGLDGSGKSTQLYLLRRWLELSGYKISFTEWNSSVLVSDATKKGKKRQLLTPTTFSLVHATDFADRYERQILPMLKAGFIVLADRYVFTAFARDSVRNCDWHWLKNMYGYAVRPDITFYFRVPTEIAVDRILSGRPKLKFFEAGMDLNLSEDISESFKIFQSRIFDAYEKMAIEYNFEIIDGLEDIRKKQKQIRSIVSEKIDLVRYRRRLR